MHFVPQHFLLLRSASAQWFVCRLGEALRQSGKARDWFSGADCHVRDVAQEVNGPLFEALARECALEDLDAIELFRRGAPMVGKLPASGCGTPCDFPQHAPVEDLRRRATSWNAELVGTLRADPNSAELLAQTKKEAKLGRMSEPIALDRAALDGIPLSPRFGVLQLREVLLARACLSVAPSSALCRMASGSSALWMTCRVRALTHAFSPQRGSATIPLMCSSQSARCWGVVAAIASACTRPTSTRHTGVCRSIQHIAGALRSSSSWMGGRWSASTSRHHLAALGRCILGTGSAQSAYGGIAIVTLGCEILSLRKSQSALVVTESM